MLITCPECAHSVSDKAIFCPSCGFPMEREQSTQIHPKTPSRSNNAVKRRKKHKKLPNGFGAIKKLSGKRAHPYAAYPATTEYTNTGSPVPVPAIGYYEDWYSAFDALREYNQNPYDLKTNEITFAELYQLYYKAKFEESKKEYSWQSKNAARVAFGNCSTLHSKKFKDLKKQDLQKIIDDCPLKHASLELILSLFKGMYKYALENDIVDKDYSRFVSINIPDDDEKGEPFTQEQIDILWANRTIPGVDTILIMIYSGFRISEYKQLEVNFTENYFQGGMKTKAGKNRIVPIHPAIRDMVGKYGGCFYSSSTEKYRKDVFRPVLQALGIQNSASGTKHTPHDCRHTFSWLCDKYKVDDLSKHMMMGHSLGNDVEKSVYGHRTLDELREEIAKILI